MDTFFAAILEMSLSASVVAILVIALRPLLRKAPKWLTCALWVLVAFRLLCPLTLESPVSMMPDTQEITQQVITLQPEAPIVSSTTDTELRQPVQVGSETPTQPSSFQFWMLWAGGVILMLGYLLVSFLTVRRRVRVFWESEPRVRQCDHIDTPFIFGIIRPKIYLPSTLPGESRDYVLAHERAHLRRKDHWWKPLGFLLLSLHWFNPVLWLSYILLCRDIELACDEKVIKTMDTAEKKAYSQALLNSSIRQRFVTACPLAFGEVGVKARIKSILSYKKPAFWIILVALIAGIGLSIFFLTDRPEKESKEPISFEAVVERQASANRLEVRTTDPAQLSHLFVHTKNLQLPTLPRGARVLITYEASEDTTDGNIKNTLDLQVLKMPRSLEGEISAVADGYLQLPNYEALDTVYYIKLQNCNFQPEPGDAVKVYYFPGKDPTRLEDVQEIQLIHHASLGVDFKISDVTPTGLQLQINIRSEFPRELFTTDAVTLKKANGANPRNIPKFPGSSFSNEKYPIADGDLFLVNWSSVYGTLAPGQYQLSKTIFYKDRRETYVVEFTIPNPELNDLDAVVKALVRYLSSQQLTDPSLPLERINTTDNLFLAYPIEAFPESRAYQQITTSHLVLEYEPFGNVHAFTIAAICQGYNDRRLVKSAVCPMRLMIRQNQDGTFTVTSCKIPTTAYWQADIEMLFSPEIAQRFLQDQTLWDSLEAACKQQVTGGVLEAKGPSKNLEPQSTEAVLLENAIAAGKKLKKPHSDSYVSTLIVGDTVYYFYFNAGIIHNATDDVYTQLTKEGTQTINTIFQSTDEESLDKNAK